MRWNPEEPVPAGKQVVIIIVDGLRPDVLLLADAPTLHGLVRNGAYSFWARTTDVAITLPSCTSMLTGVSPQKHGVNWNAALPFAQPAYPAVPTVLEMATRAGYVTALVAGKSKFSALAKPGTVTHVSVPTATKISDEQVAAEAAKIIRQFHPALLCVHFPDVDTAGHAEGWGSPAQLAQLARTDAQIAKVLAALEQAGLIQPAPPVAPPPTPKPQDKQSSEGPPPQASKASEKSGGGLWGLWGRKRGDSDDDRKPDKKK